MQIITGDETGLIKLIDLDKQQMIKKSGQQTDESILQLRTCKIGDYNISVLLSSKNVLTIMDEELEILQQYQIVNNQVNPIGLIVMNQSQNSTMMIIVAFSNGVLISLEFNYDTAEFKNEQTLQQQQKNQLQRVVEHSGKILLLWVNQPPYIFEVEKKEITWRARNVKNDSYDLQVKMDDQDGVFLDDYTIAVATLRKQVKMKNKKDNLFQIRTYDITKDRCQPLVEYDIKESSYPLKFLRLSTCGKLLYVGNLKGEVLIYNKNKNMQLVGKLKGTYGSIRDIQVKNESILKVFPFVKKKNPKNNIRVYSADLNKLLQQHNLGQRLCCVSFLVKEEGKEIEAIEKEEQYWTIKNGKEAKARFEGMRRHTIKLNYLEKMFDNHKKRKEVKKRQQEQPGQNEPEQATAETVSVVKKIKKPLLKKSLKSKFLSNKPRR